MIDIKDVTMNDIGRWVRFTYQHGETQDGRLKQFNRKYLFIVFKCDGKWSEYRDYTSESCEPESCEFISHQQASF